MTMRVDIKNEDTVATRCVVVKVRDHAPDGSKVVVMTQRIPHGADGVFWIHNTRSLVIEELQIEDTE